jgi:AraC-like DNA-binding protein
MPGSATFATDVPEVAEAMVSEAYLDVRLSLDKEDVRPFRLSIERFDAGPFRLDVMELAASARFSYEPDEEFFFVGRVTRGGLRIHADGAEELFAPGEVALVGAPGCAVETEVHDYRQLVTTLRASTVREVAGLDPGTPPPTFTSVRPISPNRARGCRRTRDYVNGLFAGDPELAGAPLVVGSASRMLAGMLLATFPNSATAPLSRIDQCDARAPGAVRRAVAFIESRADQDIGIDDIAVAAGVSRRTIQVAFRRHLDTTPTAYLRAVRLDLAHAELLAASPDDGLTVTEVAYRWGFSSPSRFTERYRAEFGRSPSEMLRR